VPKVQEESIIGAGAVSSGGLMSGCMNGRAPSDGRANKLLDGYYHRWGAAKYSALIKERSVGGGRWCVISQNDLRTNHIVIPNVLEKQALHLFD